MMSHTRWWLHSRNPVIHIVLSCLPDVDRVHFLCVDRATIMRFNHCPMQQTQFRIYSGEHDEGLTRKYLSYSIPSLAVGWKQALYPSHNSPCVPLVYHLQLDNINLLHQFRHLRSLWLNCYNHSQTLIDGLLPATLLDLSVVDYILPLSANSFPPSLEVLYLACSANIYDDSCPRTLEEGVLPSKLQMLILCCYFNTPFASLKVFPPSLKVLMYEHADLDNDDSFVPFHPHSLPSTLQHFIIGANFSYCAPLTDVLPNGLRKLDVGSCLRHEAQLRPHDLPDSLEELKIEFLYGSLVGVIPYGLQSLIVEDGFDDPIDKLFDPQHHTLHILKFDCREYDHWILPNSLPVTLTSLSISSYMLEEFRFVRDVLPPNLTELDICTGSSELFTMDSFSSCPKLEVLSVSNYSFCQVFERGMLPACLRMLVLPRGYTQKVESAVLPDSLRKMCIRRGVLQGPLTEHLEIIHYKN